LAHNLDSVTAPPSSSRDQQPGVQPRAGRLADFLISVGRPIATAAEIAELAGITTGQVHDLVRRPLAAGDLVSPGRGLYVAVRPEDRAWGGPAPAEFIDELMAHLARTYYVCLLSAAEIHGVAHQRPQVFQVMVDRQVRDRAVGRARLRFYTRTGVDTLPVETRDVPTGTYRVATPELLACDLADRPRDAGGLSNVATILAELVTEELLAPDRLAEVAMCFPVSTARRLGWLLSHATGATDLTALVRVARRDGTSPARLEPRLPRRGPINLTWLVQVNDTVEADV
jgi:predicted transcriptional regulator of viral defense system